MMQLHLLIVPACATWACMLHAAAARLAQRIAHSLSLFMAASHRAFLAARCEYFERLLFGSLKESSCREIRLHASSEAFRHVLIHLHTGHFGSIEQEACWITLMEASSLAQQYILPGMVQHVADRLSADLRPENLGLALSHALKVRQAAVAQGTEWIETKCMRHCVSAQLSASLVHVWLFQQEAGLVSLHGCCCCCCFGSGWRLLRILGTARNRRPSSTTVAASLVVACPSVLLWLPRDRSSPPRAASIAAGAVAPRN